MKKLLPFLFFVLALSLQAQDPEIWQTYRLKAKQGQSDAFEKAAAKKNKLFNNTPETAIITYQVMDGNDQGMYERIVGYKIGTSTIMNPKMKKNILIGLKMLLLLLKNLRAGQYGFALRRHVITGTLRANLQNISVEWYVSLNQVVKPPFGMFISG